MRLYFLQAQKRRPVVCLHFPSLFCVQRGPEILINAQYERLLVLVMLSVVTVPRHYFATGDLNPTR